MAGGKIKLKPKADRHSIESGLTIDTSGSGKPATSLPYEQSSINSIHIHPVPFASELDNFSATNQKIPLTAISGSAWRRPSNSPGMPATVKRSVSTPNVRGQAAADAAGLSFADKRRNKLGYHRTSVACGHCRRRKIRCLLAAEDSQGRCSNCIRLKKECNFFPVDQQPPMLDKHTRTGSKTESASGIASTSTSSSPSPLTNGQDNHNGFSAPIPSGYDFPVPTTVRHRNGSVSSSGKGSRVHSRTTSRRPSLAHMHTAPVVPKAFDYLNGIERPGVWESSSTYAEPGPLSATDKPTSDDTASASFWQLQESPITPSPYSSLPLPVGHSSMDATNGTNVYSTESQRDLAGWPLPMRSLSLSHLGQAGQLNGLQASVNYPGNYRYDSEYKSNAVNDLYPSSVNTSTASFTASISEPTSAPPDGQFVLQPGWNASFGGTHVGEMNGKPIDGFNSWYEDSGHLAQVEEETQGSHFNDDSAIFFPPSAQTAI